MIDGTILKEYMQYRREHPFLAAADALRWAKRTDYSALWEQEGHEDKFVRHTADGFLVTMTVVQESCYPSTEDDFGEYVWPHRNRHYTSDWDGNYPEPPSGEFPLGLPYTTFASGAYCHGNEDFHYYVPSYIEDHFKWLREKGCSKSVAWDMTKANTEEIIRSYFGTPLVYGTVIIEVTLDDDDIDVKLSEASIYTNYLDDASGIEHFFELADELLPEALDEAKDNINRIKEHNNA